MNSEISTEILLPLWKVFVVLCCIMCNVFFFLFRAFVRSQPFPLSQNLIINAFFSQLSGVWQIANLLSTIFLLFIDLDYIEKDIFSCTLYFLRIVQIYCSGTYIVYISFDRLFAHFWCDRYFSLPHSFLATFSIWSSIGVSLAVNIVNGWKCFQGRDSLIEKECFDGKTKTFVKFCIVPTSFFNLAIILSYIHRNRKFCMKKVRKLLIPKHFGSTVAPAPNNIEMEPVEEEVQPESSNLPDNVTFTTGLITMILATLGISALIKLSDGLGLSFSKTKIGLVYSLLNTTFISIYWLLANSELREYATRVTARLIQLWLQ